jgi:hypothetical protein
MTNADMILAGGIILLGIASAVAPAIAGLPFFADRPGLSKVIIGAGLAAGRLKQAIPAGATAAQAQALIEAEAAKLAVKYADSIKAAGMTQDEVVSTVAGLTKGQLPAGHIVADALPLIVTAEPQIQAVIAQLSDLLAKHAPAPAVPLLPLPTPAA